MASVIVDKQLAQVFRELYWFIFQNGEKTTPKSSFGGMWSYDSVRVLDGVTAAASDGGYCEYIFTEGIRVWMQFSGGTRDITVNISEGTREDFVALAERVSKAKFTNDLDHTGD